MSTTAATDTRSDTGTRGTTVTGRGVTTRQVVASELVKLRLRSTKILLAVGMLLVAAVGILITVGVIVQEAPADGFADAPAVPASAALAGLSSAVYLVAALGVVAVTSEYMRRSVESTFSAVPNRSRVVAAKALTVGGVVFAASVPTLAVTFAASQVILARNGIEISVSDPGVLRALVGAALYLTVMSWMGTAFGWLLRSTAGAYMALLGLLFVTPAVAGLVLPTQVAERVLPYLPDAAGTAVMQLGEAAPGQLAPWVGFGVFVAYAVVAMVAAAAVVRRRDA